MNARIIQLDKAFAFWIWLCEDHVAAREARGFLVKANEPPTHPLPCDDCRWGEPTTIPKTTNQGASDADR